MSRSDVLFNARTSSRRILILILLEDVGRPNTVEDELLRHFLSKFIDRFPTGAVHGHHEIGAYLLHLLNGWPNDWLKKGSAEMEPA